MNKIFSLITNTLETLVTNFGFSSLSEFFNSMVHVKSLVLTLPASIAIFGLVEKWFGFSSAIFISFVVMAMVELVTGIWGAKATGQKIQSKKVGRFGLKLLVWLTLMFVAHSFAASFKDSAAMQDIIKYQIFSWFHGVLMVYVCFEYVISIIENLAKITGQNQNKLIAVLRKKADAILGSDDDNKTLVAPKESTETVQDKEPKV